MEIRDASDSELLRKMEVTTYPILARLYNSPVELDESRSMFARYERLAGNHWDYRIQALKYLTRGGNIELALQHNIELIDGSTQGLPFPSFEYTWWLPMILHAVNTPLPEIADMMRRYWNRSTPSYRQGVAYMLHIYGVLRGEVGWANEIFMELTGAESYVEETFVESLFYWYISGTLVDKQRAARELLQVHVDSNQYGNIETARFNSGAVTDLALFVFGLLDSSREESVETAIRAELLNPLNDAYRTDDLMTTLILLVHAGEQGISSMQNRLCVEIRQAVVRTMNWLIDSRRIIFARVFPERFWHCFNEDERVGWLQRIDHELAEQQKRLRPDDEDLIRRVGVSMLGKISYRLPGEEEVGIKGIRLKQLLGLMTLNAIITRPLGRGEFFAVMAGADADAEARRNTVKVAVYQIRKLLGQQSILQGEDVPRINPELVQVDLIDAHRAISQAEHQFNHGSLKNAATQLFKGLHLLAGEVAFPTLYDPVFESAREDLESRLRRVILNTGRGLLHNGDEKTCEALLRQAI
jgi:hypothetical protein